MVASNRAQSRASNLPVFLVPEKPLESGHWMNAWLQTHERAQLVELGMWDAPHRNTWVNKLNLAIQRAGQEVIVVTEGIATLALVWWQVFERAEQWTSIIDDASGIAGAVVVSPPDFDRPGSDDRLAGFGSCPREALPFPTYIVTDFDASHEVQRCALRIAQDWQAWAVRETVRGGWLSGQTLLQSLRNRIDATPVPAAWGDVEQSVTAPLQRQSSPQIADLSL